MNKLVEQLHALSSQMLDAHNADVLEFNELFDKLEEAETKIMVRDDLLIRQNELVQKQKGELDSLLKKHNIEVQKANAALRQLEGTVASLQHELAKLRALNPEKLSKQVANLKERNTELLASNEQLKRKNGELSKAVSHLTSRLEGANKPLWSVGRESLMEAGAMNIAVCGGIQNHAVWWRHDSGFQLLCVLDGEADEIRISDPAFETGVIPLPSEYAIESIKSILRPRIDKRLAA